MREATFSGEWRKSILHHFPGSHFYKIPDLPRFSGETYTFAAVRPYDCYLLFAGKFYAQELKIMKAPASFPISRVAEHQLQYLFEVEKNGGSSFLVINYRNSELSERQQKKFSILTVRYNSAFLIKPSKFLEMADTVDGKSIPFEMFLNTCKVIKKDGEFWDVKCIVEQ